MKTINFVAPGSNDGFFNFFFSADWSYVVYEQQNGSGQPQQIFLTNLQTGATQTVATAPGNDTGSVYDSIARQTPVISPDGQFVAYSIQSFDSTAQGGATVTSTFELFDHTTGLTRTVYSDTEAATHAGQGTAVVVALSPDDQSLFFVTDYTDLTGALEGNFRVFDLNLQTGAVHQVDGLDLDVNPSPGGKYIVVQVPGAGFNYDRIDTTTGEADPIISITGVSGDDTVISPSDDGRFALLSTSGPLLPQDTDGVSDIYLKDMSTGELTLLSTTASGALENGLSSNGFISVDGSRIVFETTASNLSPGASAADPHIVSMDLATGAIGFLWDDPTGHARFKVSPDGTTLAVKTTEHLTAAGAAYAQGVYTIHFTPPQLTINPIAGDNRVTLADGPTIAISGTSDAIGQVVTIILPGSSGPLGTATVNPDGTWSTNVSASDFPFGSDTVRAFVTDGLTTYVDESITVPLNQPPSVTISSGVTTETEHTPAIIDAGITVSDVDNTTLASATVSIANFALGDVLAFTANAASFGNIQGSYDGFGTLSLTSQDASATLAQWQAALRSVTYDTTSLAPDATPRQIEFSVNDGSNESDVAPFKIVEIQRVNDPPVLVSYQGAVYADFGGDDTAFGLVLQANGDAVVFGGAFVPTTGQGKVGLARFTSSGSLDQAFGSGGKALLAGSAYVAQNGALEPDGKIVVLTSLDLGEQGLARFNADGTLDASFGSGGTVALPPDDREGIDTISQNSLAVQSDGKIIVAAQSYNGGYPNFNLPVDVLLLRYNVNGTLDTTFGSGGIVRAQHRDDSPTPSGVAVGADGKIVVTVQTVADGPQYLIERYNSDGTLDTSFGNEGIASSPIQKVQLTGQISNDVLAPVILSGGKILVASSGYNTDRTASDIELVRYNHDGSVDSTFGGNGTVTIDLAQFDEAKAIALQSDGKILVLGSSGDFPNGLFGGGAPVPETFVMRFLSNGSLDTSFGTGGKAELPLVSDSPDAYTDLYLLDGLQVGSDGKIVVSGTAVHNSDNRDFVVVRLNADGSPDSSLGGAVYNRDGPPVVLDGNVYVSDPELQAAGNFDGASLTVARHGGASEDDVFGVGGSASISAGGDLVYSGVIVGSATQAGGTLVLTFNANASERIVQSIAKSVTYANTAADSPSALQIDWTISDGNSGDQGIGGSLSTTMTTDVSITGTPSVHVSIDAVAGDNMINASETSNHLAVSGTSDAIGATVVLEVDGGALPGVVVGADGTWSAAIDTTGLIDGAHQLRATVTTADGKIASASDPVTVDTVPPTFTMDFVPGVPGIPVVEVAALFSEKIGHFSPDLFVVQDSHFHVTAPPYFLDPGNDRIIQENLTSDDPARFHTFTVQVNPGAAFDLAGNGNATGLTMTVGTAFDGYIVGGTVSYANGSGNGATATTDAKGNFVLRGGNGPLVMTGGTDSSTGLAFTGTFEAPDGASVLSPLTTLLEKVIEAAPADTVAQANDAVAASLGLPAGIDLSALDAVGGALSGDAASTAAFKAGSELLDITTLIDAAGGSASEAYAALAADIGAAGTVDLTDQATIAAIGQAAGLDAVAAHVVASIVSETDVMLEQQLAGANSPLDIFVDITGASIAMQGDAASALSHTSGDDGYQRVEDSYLQNLGAILSQDDAAAADNVACYCSGTLIATDRGDVAVEDLRIGDRLETRSGLHPIKWIGTRSYGGRFAVGQKHILPICFEAGSLGEGLPRRDLSISPHHAMYLDGVLIEAKDLVNGVSIVQAQEIERVDYFHIELDSHDVILAEGAWSETFVDDNSRGMFHNAHEYAVRYPGEFRPSARYCAPRLDSGDEVEAIRQKLARRAGLAVGPFAGFQPLRGCIDSLSEGRIEGWAQNAGSPEVPVCLDIFVDSRLIGRTLANRYREDLEMAGLGSGCHAFIFVPPNSVSVRSAAIEVRRSIDGAALQGMMWHSLARSRANESWSLGSITSDVRLST